MSKEYESWIASLKVVEGTNRKRVMGGFGSTFGDRMKSELVQVNLEHLPGFAANPQSVALIASERQLDTYPGEPTANIAARLPYAYQISRFYGTSLGILLGLHFTGFDGAVLVQQNGRALQLTLPLPTFVQGQAWDPTPNLVVTACSSLAANLTSSVTPGRSIPAGTPWWTFDNNTDFCSRFAVLFPTVPALYPFNATDLARLQATIAKWRPAKATCVKVRVLTSGRMWGWPPTQKWGDGGAVWGGTVVDYAGA